MKWILAPKVELMFPNAMTGIGERCCNRSRRSEAEKIKEVETSIHSSNSRNSTYKGAVQEIGVQQKISYREFSSQTLQSEEDRWRL